MFTQDTTPYYSRLIEQNALQRESNEIAATQLKVYTKWVKAEHPEVITEDIDIYNNLILIYKEGASIWEDIDQSSHWNINSYFLDVLQPALTKKIHVIHDLVDEIKFALEIDGSVAAMPQQASSIENPLIALLTEYIEIFEGDNNEYPGILNLSDIDENTQNYAKRLIMDFWNEFMGQTIGDFLKNPALWGLSE